MHGTARPADLLTGGGVTHLELPLERTDAGRRRETDRLCVCTPPCRYDPVRRSAQNTVGLGGAGPQLEQWPLDWGRPIRVSMSFGA
jgi:hypothetical protein